MRKADRDNRTTPSGDTTPSDKKVASSRKTPPNQPTGDRQPDNQTEQSSMRKSATAKAAPKPLALQPSQPSTFLRHQSKGIAKRTTSPVDPIFGLLDLYGRQAVAEARARFVEDCFNQKLPAPHHHRPSVLLSPGQPAFNSAEIDAFFDNTPELAKHTAETWEFAKSREELHEKLRSQTEAFQRVWASYSYEQARDQHASTAAAEHETFKQIEAASPTTIEGCAALACFLLSIITEGGCDDDAFGAQHCRNLIKALSRLSGKPTPEVTGYFHSSGYGVD